MAEKRRNEKDCMSNFAMPFRPLRSNYVPTKSCIDAIRDLFPSGNAVTMIEQILDKAIALRSTIGAERNQSLDELVAIVAYTADVVRIGLQYEDNLYKRLNTILSERDKTRFPVLADWYWYLMHGLNKIPVEEATTYRGMKNVSLANSKYVRGKKVCWVAFTSTSPNTEVTRDFSGSDGTVLRIKCKTARSIMEYSLFGHEDEYLLLPNTMVEVKGAMSREILPDLGDARPIFIDNADFVSLEEVEGPSWASIFPSPDEVLHEEVHPEDYEDEDTKAVKALRRLLVTEMVDVMRYPWSPTLGEVKLSNGMTWNSGAMTLVDPDCSPEQRAVGFWALGRAAPTNAPVTLKDGRKLSERELYVEAIDCSSQLGVAFNSLGSAIAPGEKVVLRNSKAMGQRECFMEAVYLMPKSAVAYNNLGLVLAPQEILQLKDGRKFNKQHCFRAALDCDDKYATAYRNLGDAMPPGGESITLGNGKVLTKRDCYAMAIHLEPKNAWWHYSLAMSLPPGESATLKNGQKVTAKDCFAKTLTLDPNISQAYFSLAILLDGKETVKIGNADWNKVKCLVHAIKYNALNDQAYYLLSSLMHSVTLADGRKLTDKELLLEVIHLNPNHPQAYYDLGELLEYNGTITLKNGRTLEQKQLFIEAIRANPTNSFAYNRLGNVLVMNERVKLHDGRSVDQRQCYIDCIHLNPQHSMAYNNLSFTVNNPERILLRDGRSLARIDCYMEAVSCDPKNAMAYNNLGNALASGQKVKLRDGRTLGRRDCYLSAIDADPQNESAYNNLYSVLGYGETITLKDGRTLTRSGGGGGGGNGKDCTMM